MTDALADAAVDATVSGLLGLPADDSDSRLIDQISSSLYLRVGATEQGRRAWEGLEIDPGSPVRRSILTEAVASELVADPRFAAQIKNLVLRLSGSGNTSGGRLELPPIAGPFAEANVEASTSDQNIPEAKGARHIHRRKPSVIFAIIGFLVLAGTGGAVWLLTRPGPSSEAAAPLPAADYSAMNPCSLLNGAQLNEFTLTARGQRPDPEGRGCSFDVPRMESGVRVYIFERSLTDIRNLAVGDGKNYRLEGENTIAGQPAFTGMSEGRIFSCLAALRLSDRSTLGVISRNDADNAVPSELCGEASEISKAIVENLRAG